MLVVEELVKNFNGYKAVDNLSFKVESGKIFGLLGPNGAGKTTTLRTVLNILKPNSGKILFDGSPITSEFYNSIGYLPEERGLYKKSKVLDVIIYFAELKSIKKQTALKLADEWLKKLNNTTLVAMSGSGACVFAEFANERAARHAFQQLPNEMSGFVAEGLASHPLQDFLEK